MSLNADQTRAVLSAYQLVMTASWPTLHPEMLERSAHWASASAETLDAELQSYLRQASDPHCCAVRIGALPARTQATIGILGMYEMLDDETGRRLFGEQSRRSRRP